MFRERQRVRSFIFEFDFILYVSVSYCVGGKCLNFGSATFRAKDIQTIKGLQNSACLVHAHLQR